MTEITGNIWDFHSTGEWIVITTNGTTKNNGGCVMGRGVADQARIRYPTLQADLGAKIRKSGNHVYRFPALHIFTFPVKHGWWEVADLELIRRSAQELLREVAKDEAVFLPRPGCGSGKLLWEDVEPYLDCLDERFVIVSLPS